VQVFSANQFHVTEVQNGMPVVLPSFVNPYTNTAISMLQDQRQLSLLASTKEYFERQLVTDSTQFAKDFARMVPKALNVDEILPTLRAHSELFRVVGKRIDDLYAQNVELRDRLNQLHEKSDGMMEAIKDLTVAGEKNSIEAITAAVKRMGVEMNAAGYRNELTEFTLAGQLGHTERHLDGNSIQDSMAFDLVKEKFGLAYLVEGPPRKGDVEVDQGRASNPPFKNAGSMYQVVGNICGIDILEPSPNAFAGLYNRFAGPFGVHLCILRVASTEGWNGHIDILTYYDGRSGSAGVIARGHSKVMRKFFSDITEDGIVSYLVAQNGVGLRKLDRQGLGHLVISPNRMKMNSTTRDGFNKAAKQIVRHVCSQFNEERICLQLKPLCGRLDQFFKAAASNAGVLVKLENHISSPIRYAVRDILEKHGFGDVYDAMMDIGRRVGDYAAANLDVPAVEDILEEGQSELMVELLMIRSRAITGISKPEHTRLGKVSRTRHFAKGGSSTIMAVEWGMKKMAYICPACGAGYHTTLERQFCNVMDHMFVTVMTFGDKYFPAVPVSLRFQNQRDIDGVPHTNVKDVYGDVMIVDRTRGRIPIDSRHMYANHKKNIIETTGDVYV